MLTGNNRRFSPESLKFDNLSTPLLNDFPTFENLNDGSVVRLRAMVQDNLDRVMKHKSYGDYELRYRSGMEEVPESYVADFGCSFYNVDRYILVSIPGVDASPSLTTENIAAFLDEQSIEHARATESSTKQTCENREADTECMNDNPPQMIPVDSESDSVPQQSSRASSPSPHPIPKHLLKDKAPSRFSCLANVCDAEREFRLHDVVDVVGVLYNSKQDPSLPALNFTIEVIHIEPASPSPIESIEYQPETAREMLKGALSQILLGDETAAEYLLLQLVSNRIEGFEALPTMGSWTLSLSNADDVQVDRLVELLKSVSTTPVVSFVASNSVLMEEKFYPIRLPDAEYTSPGMLQLAPKTVVVIDERSLGEGNVNALNILAINKAVREQVLVGVFGDSSCIDFPIDLKFIILNRGRTRSIFEKINPSTGINGSVPLAHVELRPREISTNALGINAREAAAYIAIAQSRIKDVQISDEIVTRFQNDWVESRKNDPKIPTDDIHIWATLMRSVAASHGAESVVSSHLDNLLDMELTRRSRCPELPALRENQDIQAVVGG